jgi:hypothetical protein
MQVCLAVGLHDQPGGAGPVIAETHKTAARGTRYLRVNGIPGQVDCILGGVRLLSGMGEGRGAGVRGQLQPAGNRHEGEAAIILRAGAAEKVASTKPLDAAIRRVIRRNAFGFPIPRLRCPVGHGERHTCNGKGLPFGRRPDKRIDQDRHGLA